MSFIKGNYKKTIFSSNEGYKVGLFRIKEASEDLKYYIGKSITFTGYFHDLNDLDTYIFNGSLVEHKKYGEQFSVTDYSRVVPEGKDSIIEFLSSGLFKGIGEKKAEKIVNTIGKDTLKVILDNPNDLLSKISNYSHAYLINSNNLDASFSFAKELAKRIIIIPIAISIIFKIHWV